MAGRYATRSPDERERIHSLLRARASELRARGIRRLDLFGSVARDEAHPDSDVDLLAELDAGADLGFGVVSLKDEIDQLLGRPVGLAFASRLCPGVRASIERDLVHVF
jgi:predicted nucleotidyltransferase